MEIHPGKILIVCATNKALGIKEKSFKQFKPVGFFHKFIWNFIIAEYFLKYIYIYDTTLKTDLAFSFFLIPPTRGKKYWFQIGECGVLFCHNHIVKEVHRYLNLVK